MADRETKGFNAKVSTGKFESFQEFEEGFFFKKFLLFLGFDTGSLRRKHSAGTSDPTLRDVCCTGS